MKLDENEGDREYYNKVWILRLTHLVPVSELVMGQIKFNYMSTEGSDDFSLFSCMTDSRAIQNQNTGQVQTVWRQNETLWTMKHNNSCQSKH